MYACPMHPGQFTVPASDNPDIVNRSIEEFEYPWISTGWMGYGKKFRTLNQCSIPDAKVPEGIKSVPTGYSRSKKHNQQSKTKKTPGTEHILNSGHCGLVLDIHHHWCREGEYIEVTDDRVKRVIDSWRGVCPAMHYSISPMKTVGDWTQKAKLRAHSDMSIPC